MLPLRWLRRKTAKPSPPASASPGLVEARAAIARWKDRCAEATRTISALKQRVTTLEQELAAVRQRRLEAQEGRRHYEQQTAGRMARQAEALTRVKRIAERTHRAILSPSVLRASLPLRRPVARARAAGAEARERERRFLAVSPSYQRAVAAAGAPPPADAPVVKTDIQGVHWWVPVLRPRDAAPGSAWLRKQKFPYRGISQTRELGMGGLMLDLGANIGRMSLPRVILGDVVAAYCAEPDPLNYDCLVRNIVDNGLGGLMCADNVAISDREGTATLSRASYCGGHSLVDSSSAKGGTVTVPTTTLDAWVSRLAIDLELVTFIKVDVQGWEGHLFAGAGAVLACRHITWQVEFKPGLLREAGTDPAELCRRLRDSFTHFSDMNKFLAGPRVRPVAELDEALAYVEPSESGQTDILLFHQSARTS